MKKINWSEGVQPTGEVSSERRQGQSPENLETKYIMI